MWGGAGTVSAPVREDNKSTADASWNDSRSADNDNPTGIHLVNTVRYTGSVNSAATKTGSRALRNEAEGPTGNPLCIPDSVHAIPIDPAVIPHDDNLIIKGDNLVGLHWMLEEGGYRGKVKCIYIDPPYFFTRHKAKLAYNSNFQKEAWLAFLKERLTLARELLSDDGSFFAQISDQGVGELLVLLKEIFGERNFVNMITTRTKSTSGFATVNKGLFNAAEYILVFAKNRQKWQCNNLYTSAEWDDAYRHLVENPDDHPSMWRTTTIADHLAAQQGYDTAHAMRKALGAQKVRDMEARYAAAHPHQVFRFNQIRDNAGATIANIRDESKRNPRTVYTVPRAGHHDVHILRGREMTFYERKLRMIDGKLTPAVKMSNIWTDVSYDGISPEGGVQLRGGKKPERLMRRILQLATNECDLVVDFFLGSGTTAAVAHKMGRKYIGIEQMDYIKHITTQRLIDVIGGDTTGISKEQGWAGGGAFTYAELAEGYDETGETSGGIV